MLAKELSASIAVLFEVDVLHCKAGMPGGWKIESQPHMTLSSLTVCIVQILFTRAAQFTGFN